MIRALSRGVGQGVKRARITAWFTLPVATARQIQLTGTRCVRGTGSGGSCLTVRYQVSERRSRLALGPR